MSDNKEEKPGVYERVLPDGKVVKVTVCPPGHTYSYSKGAFLTRADIIQFREMNKFRKEHGMRELSAELFERHTKPKDFKP